jgi:hypothetical protein
MISMRLYAAQHVFTSFDVQGIMFETYGFILRNGRDIDSLFYFLA